MAYSIYDEILKRYKDKYVNNYKNIYEFIVDFISRNGEALGSRNPGKYIYFTKMDEKNFFEAVDVPENEIKQIINGSTYIQKSWQIANKPVNMVMDTLVFFYYQTAEKFKNMSYPPHNFVNFMFCMRFYSSLQQRQFKYEVDEAVMEYTVENLSKKYNITKANSMFEILSYYADSNIVTWEKDKKMTVTTDKSLVDYMNKLNTRLSSFIINVAREYYKNHNESKKVIEEQTEVEYEEGKAQLKTQTNISNDIVICTRKVYLAFNNNPIDINLLKTACKNTDASLAEMSVIMDDIRKANEPQVEELINKMITYYLVSEKMPVNAIKNAEFLRRMTTAYGISNTKDEYILRIKEILDYLMNKYSDYYTKTNRAATKHQMRAATYRYFVYIIMKYSD